MYTSVGNGHLLNPMHWAQSTLQEAIGQTYLSKFSSPGKSNIVEVKSELSRGHGDTIRYAMYPQIQARGVVGSDNLTGNLIPLTSYTDQLVINQLRFGVGIDGLMSEQRSVHDLREIGRDQLSSLLAERLDVWFFNTLAGNTGESDTAYTGFNATTAPSTYRYFQTDQTAEVSLTTGDEFNVSIIDKAVNRAKTFIHGTQPLIKPVMTERGPMFVLFIHPNQTRSLRASAGTAGSWFDTHKSAMMGGDIANNPIFSGALGIWNNTIIHESPYVPAAPTNSSARRAIFCGANAVTMAFGMYNGKMAGVWNEELEDHKDKFEISVAIQAGMKKNVFNSVDYATIVLSSYAPDVS